MMIKYYEVILYHYPTMSNPVFIFWVRYTQELQFLYRISGPNIPMGKVFIHFYLNISMYSYHLLIQNLFTTEWRMTFKNALCLKNLGLSSARQPKQWEEITHRRCHFSRRLQCVREYVPYEDYVPGRLVPDGSKIKLGVCLYCVVNVLTSR